MQLNNACANSQIGNLATDFATASLVIYTAGSGVPADANTAITDQVALATHTLAGFGAPGTPGAGQVTANAIADDTIDATGTAAFARLTNGTETVQLTVGVGGAFEVDVNSTSYIAGNTSTINSVVLSQPLS